ncbi:alpha/beta fold hydrolase [Allosaccharopolyspora coralli]|uniref:Alpha/beta fold hydrolase n=2 Tax=Allosaccharopolyspora coralli TaxID=2665642 RepID=A0A5Q3QBT1_9PSEU|nr:alpha/beta fold hydrolase [Allosaccharopolyspora coralli]
MGTNGAEAPQLGWGPCADAPGYECATAEVPLSYRDPGGQTIRLAVGKLPATDQENKIGTIFYNPGGPGGPGRIPPAITEGLHEKFDIVGFDPRGVGASTGLRCLTPEQESAIGTFPVTPRQEQEIVAAAEAASETCADSAGPLLHHMSTANVARDMDLLREAVGEEQTNYYGVSYGTHLGAVYANLFPDRVRAMTIDSALDPVEWTTGYPGEQFTPMSYRLGSADGAQRALGAFFAECQRDERCAFRAPGEDLQAKYDEVLDRLLERPVQIVPPGGSEPMEITYQVAVQSTLGALYNAANAPMLADFLQTLHQQTRPEAAGEGPPPVVAVPDPAPRPGFAPQTHLGVEQSLSVLCAETSNPANPYEWGRYARKADETARGFGSSWTYLSLPCATWPSKDVDRYAGPWDRQTANPILTIGNSLGDPATPYEDTVAITEMLSDARLLTLDTFGHGALRQSVCVDDAMNRYFETGELPKEGAVCTPDRSPFDPAPQP